MDSLTDTPPAAQPGDLPDQGLALGARRPAAGALERGLARIALWIRERGLRALRQAEAARLAQDLSRLTRLGSRYYGAPWDIKNAERAKDPGYEFLYKKGEKTPGQLLVEKSGGLERALRLRAARSSPEALAIAMEPAAVWALFEKRDELSYERRAEVSAWRIADWYFKRELACSPLGLAYYGGSPEAAALFESWGAKDRLAPLWGSALGSSDLGARAKKLGLKRPARLPALALAYASGNQQMVDFALKRSPPLDERQSALCWGLSAGSESERAALEALSLAHVCARPAAPKAGWIKRLWGKASARLVRWAGSALSGSGPSGAGEPEGEAEPARRPARKGAL